MMDFDQSNFNEDRDPQNGHLERIEELFSVLDLAESQVCVGGVVHFPSLAKCKYLE